MKKLLVITGLLSLFIAFGCKDRDSDQDAPGTGSQAVTPGDSTGVMALTSSVAKEMIKHFKSAQVAGNREKLFKGGVKISRLDSILNGATGFNIFSAAYPADFSDSLKRNMPTFILQVMKTSAGAEATTLYYAVDSDKLCPPPPDCNTAVE